MSVRARALVVAALVLALAVLATSRLLQEQQHYAGTNSIGPNQPVLMLKPGQRACQSGEVVPRQAMSVELVASSSGRPGAPLAVALRDDGGAVFARGSVPGGYRDGYVAIAIPVQRRTRTGVEVCFEAERGGTRYFGLANAQGKLQLDGRPAPGALRIAFRRPGRESWLALAPTIADRFDIAKTRLAGDWTFWALAVLVLALAGLAIRTALRPERATS